MAEAIRFSGVFRVYRSIKAGIQLHDIIPHPTEGLIDALTIIDRASNLAQTREIERETDG